MNTHGQRNPDSSRLSQNLDSRFQTSINNLPMWMTAAVKDAKSANRTVNRRNKPHHHRTGRPVKSLAGRLCAPAYPAWPAIHWNAPHLSAPECILHEQRRCNMTHPRPTVEHWFENVTCGPLGRTGIVAVAASNLALYGGPSFRRFPNFKLGGCPPLGPNSSPGMSPTNKKFSRRCGWGGTWFPSLAPF